jgi:hypothetical protein
MEDDQVLVSADNVNLLGENINIISKIMQALLVPSEEVGPEVDADGPGYRSMFREQHTGLNHNLKT